jgi:5'-phosphate synthase pdxT subunit
MKIGVLGLQGDFREHLQMLAQLDVETIDVRLPEDLEGTQGLIIPGGESTTLRKLLIFSELDKAIIERAQLGYAIYGTCAGMILLARELVNDSETETLDLMDIVVSRNAYGRQVDSFEADVDIKDIGSFHAVFIRAPQIAKHGQDVEVLCAHNNVPILARQGNMLVSSFHPEIYDDPRIHDYFVRECAANEKIAVA